MKKSTSLALVLFIFTINIISINIITTIKLESKSIINNNDNTNNDNNHTSILVNIYNNSTNSPNPYENKLETKPNDYKIPINSKNKRIKQSKLNNNRKQFLISANNGKYTSPLSKEDMDKIYIQLTIFLVGTLLLLLSIQFTAYTSKKSIKYKSLQKVLNKLHYIDEEDNIIQNNLNNNNVVITNFTLNTQEDNMLKRFFASIKRQISYLKAYDKHSVLPKFIIDSVVEENSKNRKNDDYIELLDDRIIGVEIKFEQLTGFIVERFEENQKLRVKFNNKVLFNDVYNTNNKNRLSEIKKTILEYNESKYNETIPSKKKDINNKENDNNNNDNYIKIEENDKQYTDNKEEVHEEDSKKNDNNDINYINDNNNNIEIVNNKQEETKPFISRDPFNKNSMKSYSKNLLDNTINLSTKQINFSPQRKLSLIPNTNIFLSYEYYEKFCNRVNFRFNKNKQHEFTDFLKALIRETSEYEIMNPETDIIQFKDNDIYFNYIFNQPINYEDEEKIYSGDSDYNINDLFKKDEDFRISIEVLVSFILILFNIYY